MCVEPHVSCVWFNLRQHSKLSILMWLSERSGCYLKVILNLLIGRKESHGVGGIQVDIENKDLAYV